LKAGLWFRRARLVILAPDPRHPRRAQAENPLNDLSKFSRPPLPATRRQPSYDPSCSSPVGIAPPMDAAFTHAAIGVCVQNVSQIGAVKIG
jgi:hypothetical protein